VEAGGHAGVERARSRRPGAGDQHIHIDAFERHVFETAGRIVVLNTLVAYLFRDILDAALDGAGAALLRLLGADLLAGDAVIGDRIDLDRVPGLFRMAAALGRFHRADVGIELAPAILGRRTRIAMQHFERGRDVAVHVDDPIAVTHYFSPSLNSGFGADRKEGRRALQNGIADRGIAAAYKSGQHAPTYHARASATRR